MGKMPLLLVIVILSSFAYAGVEEAIAACGTDIRCKFRVAAITNDAAACEALGDDLGEDCRELLGEEALSKVKEEQKALSSKAISDGRLSEPLAASTIVGVVIVILTFLFIMLYLHKEHQKHAAFMKDNSELVDYVKKSRDRGLHDHAITVKLQSAGWREDYIKEAIRGADIKK